MSLDLLTSSYGTSNLAQPVDAPAHIFLLIPANEQSYARYPRALQEHAAPSVLLSDAVVWYMHDTLCWIPTLNPTNQQELAGYGLNLYGITIINCTGAAVAQQVFRTWADLFATGPETLHLRGPWSEQPGEDPDSVEQSGYTTCYLERDTLVAALRTLATFAEQARSGEFVLLHAGV